MFLILILFCITPLALSKGQLLNLPQSYIKTTQLECKFDPEWIANLSCKLKPVSWQKTLANVTFDIVKPLTNVSLNIQFFRRETRFIPFLVNITRNFCQALTQKNLDYYLTYFLEMTKKFVTNKLPTCPLTGHVEAINCYIDADYFKYSLISGLYRVVIKAFEGNPLQLQPIGYFKMMLDISDKN